MKHTLFFLTILFVTSITACSSSGTDAPVAGTTLFDGTYNIREHKIDLSNDIQHDIIEFEHDLSQIESNDAKQLIINLYNQYNYSSYSLHDLSYDNMDGVDVTYYVVALDNDYWVITSNSNKAYASKDEQGIYSGVYDYLIDETETPYR